MDRSVLWPVLLLFDYPDAIDHIEAGHSMDYMSSEYIPTGLNKDK